jgi:two-component system sporulation sensor kinase B
MELLTKDLLINFLFILLPLFLLQLFYSLRFVYQIDKLKNLLFTLVSMLSIGLCMLFPFGLGDGLIFDLRRVPFIIGVLYGGPKIGIMCGFFNIYTWLIGYEYRLLYYSDNIFICNSDFKLCFKVLFKSSHKEKIGISYIYGFRIHFVYLPYDY